MVLSTCVTAVLDAATVAVLNTLVVFKLDSVAVVAPNAVVVEPDAEVLGISVVADTRVVAALADRELPLLLVAKMLEVVEGIAVTAGKGLEVVAAAVVAAMVGVVRLMLVEVVNTACVVDSSDCSMFG